MGTSMDRNAVIYKVDKSSRGDGDYRRKIQHNGITEQILHQPCFVNDGRKDTVDQPEKERDAKKGQNLF